MQNTRVSQLGQLLQVGVQRGRIEQDRRLPGGLLEGLGQVLHYFLRILVKHGIVLHDQEAVVVIHQDGHELEGGVGAAHFQGGVAVIQPAEGAGVVAADKEELRLLAQANIRATIIVHNGRNYRPVDQFGCSGWSEAKSQKELA